MEIQNEGSAEVISTIVYQKDPDVIEPEPEMAKEPAKIVTNLDICFMLDCTGSMQSYIDRSRNKIKDIIEEVKQQYPDSEIQVGIVGYRDIQDTKRFEILPFTSNIHSAKEFLDAIRADGGGDTPEDVNGAFQQTLGKMEWQGQAKMIVHIADAPCHGKNFHSCWGDNHPDGHKEDVAWDVLFKQIVDNHIDYLFLKIGSDTDKMFTKFKEIAEGLGASANGVLFKQEPISNADAAAAAPVTTFATSLFTSTAPTKIVERKKRTSRKEVAKKEKEVKKGRGGRSSSKKADSRTPSRSRSKSTKTRKEKKSHKEESDDEEVEEVKDDWAMPNKWTRSKYQEWLDHGGKEQKKAGYWTIPQTDESALKMTRKRTPKKKTTKRKSSVSKDRSEKKEKKTRKTSTKRKASTSRDKDREASRERTKKAQPKRAFLAPEAKVSDKFMAPVMFPPGMSAMDEQEYFAKLLSKEMKESINRKKIGFL